LLKSSPQDRRELKNAVVQAPKLPAVALAEALKSTLPPLALGPKAEFVMPRGKARCGLVWMHGLGDTEEGWAENMEEEFAIPRDVGPCKYILPRAPVQAVSCNGGDRMTSWFDMRKLPLRSTDLPPRHDCSLEQALASCGRIHAAIQKLIDEGIPAERIVVGGFSQGGAMAVLSALTFPQRLAGVIVFSGIIFYGDMLAQLVTPITKDLPFFWGHGTADEVLHISLQEEGAQLLADCGFKVVTKQYPVPHSSHQEEFKEAASFFASVVGAAEIGGK
jgi:predicted esterase